MSYVSTDEETGYFSAAFRIVEVVGVIPWLLVSAGFPILARAARDDDERLALRAAEAVRGGDRRRGAGSRSASASARRSRSTSSPAPASSRRSTCCASRRSGSSRRSSLATWLFALLSLKLFRQLLIANTLGGRRRDRRGRSRSRRSSARRARRSRPSPPRRAGARLPVRAAPRERPALRPSLVVVPKVAVASALALVAALLLDVHPVSVALSSVVYARGAAARCAACRPSSSPRCCGRDPGTDLVAWPRRMRHRVASDQRAGARRDREGDDAHGDRDRPRALRRARRRRASSVGPREAELAGTRASPSTSPTATEARLVELLRGADVVHRAAPRDRRAAACPRPRARRACRTSSSGTSSAASTRSPDEARFDVHLFISKMMPAALPRRGRRAPAAGLPPPPPRAGAAARAPALRGARAVDGARRSELLGLDPDRPVVGRVGRAADGKWRDLLVDMVPPLLERVPGGAGAASSARRRRRSSACGGSACSTAACCTSRRSTTTRLAPFYAALRRLRRARRRSASRRASRSARRCRSSSRS